MQPGKAKEGMRVRVSTNLQDSKTKEHWNLDETGNMVSMQGRVFPIRNVRSSEKITIDCPEAGRYYIFHIDDLEPVEIEEQPPVIVNFDERLLDL